MARTRSDGAPTREAPLWVWILVLVFACVMLALEIVHPITALSWPGRTGSAAAGVVIGLVTPVTRFKNGTTTFVFTIGLFVLMFALRSVSALAFEAVYVAAIGAAFGAALCAILQSRPRPQNRIQ